MPRLDKTMVTLMQDSVEKLLRSTNRDNVDRLIDFMKDNRYYAVQSGRHHRFVGGMAQHAMETYLYAIKHAKQDTPTDSVIITSLLHVQRISLDEDTIIEVDYLPNGIVHKQIMYG